MVRRSPWMMFVFGLGMLGLVTVNGYGKGLSQKEARRLIASIPGIELKTSAVLVKEISSTDTSATVVADVETAFRFEKSDDGRWVVTEFRAGDRNWEALDLLAGIVGAEEIARTRAELAELASEFEALQREQREGPRELARGAVRFKEISPRGSSALIVADVMAAFRFEKGGNGRWRVAGVRIGDSEWKDVGALTGALNAGKNERARAELEMVRAALEAFQRERGFYVIAETHAVLIDHLNPRYSDRIIRIDPWNRPYRYEGTRERFSLSSDGADGKAGTADDVIISSR